jgi:hypothetical protein
VALWAGDPRVKHPLLAVSHGIAILCVHLQAMGAEGEALVRRLLEAATPAARYLSF